MMNAENRALWGVAIPQGYASEAVSGTVPERFVVGSGFGFLWERHDQHDLVLSDGSLGVPRLVLQAVFFGGREATGCPPGQPVAPSIRSVKQNLEQAT